MGFFMGRSWPCCLLRLRQLVLPTPGQELGLHPGPSAHTGLLCPCGGSREHSQSSGRLEGCESHLASRAASSGRDLLLPPPAQREFARYGSVWGGHHSDAQSCSTATLVRTGDRDRQQGGAQGKESPAAPAEVRGVPCPGCTVRGELQARLWPLRGLSEATGRIERAGGSWRCRGPWGSSRAGSQTNRRRSLWVPQMCHSEAACVTVVSGRT